MGFKHIVFDIDGTLMDTEYAVLQSFQETIEEVQGRYMEKDQLRFCLGITGVDALERLNIPDIDKVMGIWVARLNALKHTVSIFEGIEDTVKALKDAGYTLGVVTSKDRALYEEDFACLELAKYFDYYVCADDTKEHKPNPGPLLKYMELSGALKEEIIYIGDSIYDMKCARGAGACGALALWGCRAREPVHADKYLKKPSDVLDLLAEGGKDTGLDRWLNWAKELQFIAQAGITYSRDPYDVERFERVREIAAEMMCLQTGFPMQFVRSVFCNETGFQTPKLDTRAAIFQDGKILLVKENAGTWSLPGGWVDVNESIKSNTVKEVKEEAGLDVRAVRLIAVQDRNKHNLPVYAYGICKAFVLCELLGGDFLANIETTESRYFAEDELPALAQDKNTQDQIRMCFRAMEDELWVTRFD